MAQLAPKVKGRKPKAGPALGEEFAEVLSDAINPHGKTAESYNEDIVDAFNQMPKEAIENAAALCRDMGNDAAKKEDWETAAGHYTSVLAAYPHDHEVLCNRSLCYLHLKRGQESLNDAALAVNLKPKFTKGYYRLGCALEECKMWKESAAIFAKVVEMEPNNVEASGRLIKARGMLEMVMNVERVQDPNWMHKPAPEKTELEKRTEEAQALTEKEMGALREELGQSMFDPEYLQATMSVTDKWYADSMMAKGLNAHLLAHSAVLAPRMELTRMLDKGYCDSFCEAIRAHVPQLVPSGKSGVVLLLGSAMGLLPVVTMEAGANQVYVCEPHGFCAKMAHATVGRHTLISFERENWSRLPMSIGMAERTKQAGSAAFKMGKYDQAIALYSEALQAVDTLSEDGELKANLLCNRSLAYLKLKEGESALTDAKLAQKCMPEFAKAHYRAAQAYHGLGMVREATAALQTVLKHSKGAKNDEAEKMLAELKEQPARITSTMSAPSKNRLPARQDKGQRLTVQEVNDTIEARCNRVKALHKPFADLRMHHEINHKIDCLYLSNFDFQLLGMGLIQSVNNLKQQEILRKDALVFPPAARVWAMAVQVLTDTGVPVHMEAIERVFWSPVNQNIYMDKPFYRRVIKPLTKPTIAFCFDFRGHTPLIKADRFQLDLTVVDDGKVNAVVFWYEMPLGQAGTVTTAPTAALPPGARQLGLGQAMQWIPVQEVHQGQELSLEARHNKTSIFFGHPGRPADPPRRGLVLGSQLRYSQDSHFNRTLAAAVRKAMFRLKPTEPALVLHVNSGFGTQSIVAAQARPSVSDFVVACEKSATLIGVAERAARDNSVSERICFLQKDCRNLKAHEDLKNKADILILECVDTPLINEGILHYLQHLRGSFTKEYATIIPAAAVMKGMLVQMRNGEIHGVDMTMSDAYRWSKEVFPVHLQEGEYIQLTEVFDMFVFDFGSSAVEQQIEHLDVVIAKDGIVSAIVFWFDLILDEEIIVSTSPFVPESQQLSFGQGLVYLQPAETRVKRGATVPLLAAHNSVEMAFTIEEDKMTRKGSDCETLSHTRFDPRWEGARANLDDQWKKIMQSLGYNPKECHYLQEAVMRFAAQPAAFGVDSGVAERCSLTFLAE
eukprot:CAMPEP_0119341952 /NCGR_PEP_ID=MMETSP1333-20130426/103705_1 /TAXON_ID=418940 /ORGANISM="Scyphosphaera apsteinii, Strain RCC1455" /LENGTH=1126 /DNA_ID=CAMNT_0007354061 /DNA_START=48 /DNA_END=3428 /DNA_ORIENTATION=+